MTGLCGHNDGGFKSPVARGSGFGCVEWEFPGVFGCTAGASTILPPACVEVGELCPTPTDGVQACYSDAPYCITMSLSWSGYFYTHWECNTQPVNPIPIMATPTITGPGEVSTRYLDAAPWVPGPASPTASPSGGSGGSGHSSNWGGSKTKTWERQKQRDQGFGHHRDLMVRRNGDMMSVAGDIERGRG
ncbi:hypothetical protein AYL99_08813 [Fonsecaea erecta]|uniref:Uncharacterized protein n=1 Tax=Fonsecaea erecta TaxID=1367422 RepID=A0A178ZB42_9EURO|nr:hypothetical protein AYL99_08813 [Fonsecaea erecta]OAP56701.1 hypothetical protein AYL99_08813 [Fonsecaea erecta]